jgi:flagellar biosynthesis protein FlhA
MRHWERTQTFTPPDAKKNDNEVLQETILWLDRNYLSQVNWDLPMWTADEAILYWLEITLRRNFEEVFDEELLNELVREIESQGFDVRGIPLSLLRQVIVNFVHEFVPVGGRWPILIQEMQRGAENPDVLTQYLREHLGAVISEHFANEYGELAVIILDEGLEKRLMKMLRSTSRGRLELSLHPGEAHALATAVSRHLERSLRENNVKPIVVCERSLRYPLFRILECFDPRVLVLSYTELSPDLRLVDAGMLFDWPRAKTDT